MDDEPMDPMLEEMMEIAQVKARYERERGRDDDLDLAPDDLTAQRIGFIRKLREARAWEDRWFSELENDTEPNFKFLLRAYEKALQEKFAVLQQWESFEHHIAHGLTSEPTNTDPTNKM